MKLTRCFPLLLLLYCLSFLLPFAAGAQGARQPRHRHEQHWVDSVMSTLSLRQRIAQLFIVPVNITGGRYNSLEEVSALVRGEQVGGVIVMKAQPAIYAAAVNRLQRESRVPLLLAIDGEWGVGMRMDSVLNFPRQMMLGALSDNSLIEKMGEAVAAQCRRMGIHLNFAPVADVNNNPNNPVINIRSFGENKYNVAEKSVAYMHGMQNKGVLACAKHFPGHGDTNQDSHELLPFVGHSAIRIDSLELYPFRTLMETGVDAVMVAHLQIPSYDTLHRPSTLSPTVTGRLLREELEFGGLVITDALNMKAVTTTTHPDTIALSALLAGNDVLLMPANVPTAIDVIEQAVKEGTVSRYKVNIRCRKMLAAKYRAGLDNYSPIRETGLADDLNNARDRALNYRLTEKSLTLLRNRDSLLPLRRPETLKIALLEIGMGRGDSFKRQLRDYAAVDTFSINAVTGADTLLALKEQLAPYDVIIAGYHDTDARPQFNFGVDSLMAQFLTGLAAEKNVVLDFFGSPYGITKFSDHRHIAALIVSYTNSSYSQERSAQLIFGGVAAKGSLPVSIDSSWIFGNGIKQEAPVSLHYILPEEAGIDGRRFERIDMLATRAAQKGGVAGELLAVYKGDVFYRKSFGVRSAGVVSGGGRAFTDSLTRLFAGCYEPANGRRRPVNIDAGPLCWTDAKQELTVIFLPDATPAGKKAKKLPVFPRLFSQFLQIIKD